MAKFNRKQVKEFTEQMRKAKTIDVESPEEIINQILGLVLWEFQILTGDEAYCADEEIFLDFQGKEMRIYIHPETKKLTVYTD